MKLLKGLAIGGKSIVTVMHDLPLAFNFSDEIILIHGGGIAARATPTELCKMPIIHEVFNVFIGRDDASGKFYLYN